jgi:hypothetical protein
VNAKPATCGSAQFKWIDKDALTQSPTSLVIGAHVATPRRGYVHHGIYVGDGEIVHYSGLAHGLRRGPVERVTVNEFTGKRPLWLATESPSRFSGAEVVRRALSRIGEDKYRVLTNNCEHFCGWCLRGESRSPQVDAWLRRAQRAAARLDIGHGVEEELVNG